jgi:ADP-ribose pyrophosphatase
VSGGGQIVFQGRRFLVCRQQVTVGGGSPHVYEIVVHPGAAVVLPLLPDGRVLLIGHFRVAVGRELLELPAGTLEAGEEPAECARRELLEETGWRAGRIEPLMRFLSSPGICDECLHAFVARELQLEAPCREEGEQIRLVPMAYDEALAAVGDGRISDGKTMLTLLYYDRYVRRNAR